MVTLSIKVEDFKEFVNGEWVTPPYSLVVDKAVFYLIHYLSGKSRQDVFHQSLLGAERICERAKAESLLNSLGDIDDKRTYINAFKLAGYDLLIGDSPLEYFDVDSIDLVDMFARNIRVLLKRTMLFIDNFGLTGLDLEHFVTTGRNHGIHGKYRELITSGDGHLVTIGFDLNPVIVNPTNASHFEINDYGEILNYNADLGGFDVNIPKEINGVLVTSISKAAFANKHLTSVHLPNGLLVVGESAFAGNDIDRLVIPDSVTDIEYKAFSSNNINCLVLGQGLKSIDDSAFGYNLIQLVVFPKGIDHISRVIYGNGSTSPHIEQWL